MLSHFHPIPERYGRTDGQTDRQTDERTERIPISVLSVLHCNCVFILHRLSDIYTASNNGVISEIKQIIGRKSRFFHTPAFDASVMGSPSEYCHNVWYRKKHRITWLSDDEKSLLTCLAVSTQYRRVTDGRTDGLSD